MGISRFRTAWAAALCAALSLVFCPAFRDAYLAPKAALFPLLLLPLAPLVWTRPGGGLDGPLLLLCAAALLSAWASIDPWRSAYGRYPDRLFSLAGWSACVAFFYAGSALPGREGPKPLLRAAGWGAVPVAVYAVAQWLGFDFLSIHMPQGGRAVSTLGSPVFLGAYLALTLPASLQWAREAPAGRAAAGLSLAALASTASRSAWLAAAAGAGLWAFFAFSRAGLEARGRRRLWVLGTALFLAFSAAYARRLVGAGTAASDGGRAALWRVAWEEFLERPLLGQGPDAYEIGFRKRKDERLAKLFGGDGGQSHAHNDWLQVLATLGLGGALAYLWLHLCLLKRLADALREPLCPLACGVLALGVCLKFNSPSLPVACLGALFCGCLFGAGGRAGRPWASRALFSAALVWSLWSASWAAAADWQAGAGLRLRREGRLRDAAARLERAVAWAPDVVEYRYDLANLIWDAASGMPPGEERRLVLRRAEEAALQGLLIRPLDADLHRLLGVAGLRCYERGGETWRRAVGADLKTALELDPAFAPAWAALRRWAELKGDAVLMREAEGRMRALVSEDHGEVRF